MWFADRFIHFKCNHQAIKNLHQLVRLKAPFVFENSITNILTMILTSWFISQISNGQKASSIKTNDDMSQPELCLSGVQTLQIH